MSRALGRLLGRLPWPWIARLSMLVSIGILAWGLPQLVDGDWSRFLTSTGHHAWIVGWLFVVSHLARSRTLFNVAGAWLGGWFTAIWVAVDATSGTVLDDRRHDPDRAAGDPSLSNGTELLALGDQVVLVAGAGSSATTWPTCPTAGRPSSSRATRSTSCPWTMEPGWAGARARPPGSPVSTRPTVR